MHERLAASFEAKADVNGTFIIVNGGAGKYSYVMNCTGHNLMGHNDMGHNWIGHNDMGHNYAGRSHIGHGYVGHNLTGMEFYVVAALK